MPVTLPTGLLPVVASGRLSGVPRVGVPGASLQFLPSPYYNNYCNNMPAAAARSKNSSPKTIDPITLQSLG